MLGSNVFFAILDVERCIYNVVYKNKTYTNYHQRRYFFTQYDARTIACTMIALIYHSAAFCPDGAAACTFTSAYALEISYATAIPT